MPKPEIMSPAGYWPQLRAAIEAGADAVYFGLRHFTARAKVGFEVSELAEAMATLHRRGVRGYVTFNALVFEHEIGEAARTLESIARAGADGPRRWQAGTPDRCGCRQRRPSAAGAQNWGSTDRGSAELAILGAAQYNQSRPLACQMLRKERLRLVFSQPGGIDRFSPPRSAVAALGGRSK